jgi:hypothetical protein
MRPAWGELMVKVALSLCLIVFVRPGSHLYPRLLLLIPEILCISILIQDLDFYKSELN